MRRKLFRLSVAALALAAAISMTPKQALAKSDQCPTPVFLKDPYGDAFGWCYLSGAGTDCSQCLYNCDWGPTYYNMCLS